MFSKLSLISRLSITMATLAGAVMVSTSPILAKINQQLPSPSNEFQIPPGGRQVGNQVIYEDGNVILEFESPTKHIFRPRCHPAGWLCMFEHTNWRGRMWKFQSPGYQVLEQYNAHNRMSSYHNRLPRRVAFYFRSSGNYGLAFVASPNSKSSYIGSRVNDKVTGIEIK